MFFIKNKIRILAGLVLLTFFTATTRGEICDSLLNIIQDNNTPFKIKSKLSDEIYSLLPEERIKILLAILEESKIHSNKEEQVKLYCLIGQNLLFTDFVDRNSKLYVDSASVYIDKIRSKEILGIYHYTLGDYYNHQQNFTEAHVHYYKAIKKFGNSNEHNTLSIFRNLAFFYIQRNDEKKIKEILNRMYSIIKNSDRIQSYVDYYSILSFYYSCLYQKDNGKSEWLDSAIVSDRKVIHLYENQKNSSLYPEEIACNYITLANNYLRKDNPDYAEINRLAHIASQIAAPNDTFMLVNRLWAEGVSLYKLEKTEEALTVLKNQLQLMKNWPISEHLALYSNLFGYLSKIHEELKEDEKALQYLKRKNEIDLQLLDSRNNEVVQIKSNMEAQEKERQIERQQFIILIILGGTGLLLIVFFFIIRSQRLKKKVIREELKRAQLEKESIENSLKQKDELLEKEKLEKKNIETLIQEKEEALMLTKIENHQIIDLQKNEIKILKYDLKLLQENIRKSEAEKETMKTEQNKVIVEITSLIKDRLNGFPDHQKKYLHKLSLMNNAVFILKKKNIQGATANYCILTALAMEKEHIMLCMNVSDQSVRAKRSEIRKILGVSVPTSLEVFLFDLLTTSGAKKKSS